MAVASLIMTLAFGGSLCLAPLAWGGNAAGTVALAIMPVSGILGVALGALAIIRIKFVDTTLKGIPYALGGLAVPMLYLIATIVRFWPHGTH